MTLMSTMVNNSFLLRSPKSQATMSSTAIVKIKASALDFKNSIIFRFFICSLLNTPTVRSRDGVLPASHLLSSKMQGNEVEAGNTPTVRSWEVYFDYKRLPDTRNNHR